MAKQGKAPAARRPPERFDDSALLRSAETLGRMIGALQRQLDGAARRFGRATPETGLTAKTGGTPLFRNNGHQTVVKPRKPKSASVKTTRAGKPRSPAARPVKATARKAGAKRPSRRS